MGVRKFINFSDKERPMVALKEAAAQSTRGVEHTSQSCPQGGHAANGLTESGMREVEDS